MTIPHTEKLTLKDMTLIALFTVLVIICSWITIPTVVPFTLQTFAVFITIGLLGGKRGTIAILIYILLGAIGIPVFSGFRGGAAALLGTTGGYIVGFLLTGLVMWLLSLTHIHRLWFQALSMITGLIICYAFGTIWFILVYTKSSDSTSISTALSLCVFPFIIPDIIKIILALITVKRLKRYIH